MPCVCTYSRPRRRWPISKPAFNRPKRSVKAKVQTQIRKGKRVRISGYEYSKLVARDYHNLHNIGRLMLLQGTRLSEVMQARVEHVDLERGTWLIPKSKTNAGKRTLRLTAEARSIMAVRSAAAPAAWPFPGKKAGTQLVDVENAHQMVLKATGLAFVIYESRHTFATRFYERTRDVIALKDVLGHSSLRTIMKYVHIGQEHVHAAMMVYEAGLVPLNVGGAFGGATSTKKAQPAQTGDKNISPTNVRVN